MLQRLASGDAQSVQSASEMTTTGAYEIWMKKMNINCNNMAQQRVCALLTTK